MYQDHSHATAEQTRSAYPEVWEEVQDKFLQGEYDEEFAALIRGRAEDGAFASWSLQDHIVGFLEEKVLLTVSAETAQPKTRLVTTGTMVGVTNPTADELLTFLRHGGVYQQDSHVVLIGKGRANELATFCESAEPTEDCVACILAGEGYKF